MREANAALQAVRLEAESLAQSERAAQEALETARQAWEEQRQALTAKRDDADDQLAETMAAPLPGVQAADAPQSPETDQQPACPETEEATPPSSGKLPAKRDEVYSIFQSLHFQDKTITRQADFQ